MVAAAAMILRKASRRLREARVGGADIGNSGFMMS